MWMDLLHRFLLCRDDSVGVTHTSMGRQVRLGAITRPHVIFDDEGRQMLSPLASSKPQTVNHIRL